MPRPASPSVTIEMQPPEAPRERAAITGWPAVASHHRDPQRHAPRGLATATDESDVIDDVQNDAECQDGREQDRRVPELEGRGTEAPYADHDAHRAPEPHERTDRPVECGGGPTAPEARRREVGHGLAAVGTGAGGGSADDAAP